MRTHSSLKSIVALLTAVSFAATPLAEAIAAAQAAPAPAPSATAAQPTTTPAKPAATAKPATAAAAPPPIDGGWPKGSTTPAGARLTLYQPQVASWDNKERMVAYSAVAYEVPGAEKPILGTVKFEADTSVAMDKRLVSFERLKVSEMNFATASREQTQDIAADLQTSVNSKPERIIALDRVLANIDKSAIIPKNVEGVKSDAPKIFYSATKAILVGFDGDPIWSPIKENDLKYVINTNWDVFQDGPSKTLYLRDGKYWYTATAIDGPWSPAGKLPESFKKLPPDENWKDVKANYPGDKIDAKKMPKVFVSTTPAEMILIDGTPNYLLVEGTKDLLWIENTESDVFRMQKDGPVFYLVSGRWFSAPDFNGPWTFATPSLPPQFKQIPPEHPRSRVLASVPGTDQANEAVLLAQVPQTARVNRKQLKAPDVQYAGDPKFEAIPQTQVARATNTDKDIIKFKDVYYMCTDGVWFTSKAATGPWEVASTIPKEIYEIPPSSPSHNVTYVTVVEDKSDDDWVTFAAVAGYTGMMVAWGCAVWGTGWYYPPYIGYGGFYPVYYPYYRSYGASAWYNPYTGAYGRRVSAYGPYGGVTAGARYNPRTGTYSRGAMRTGRTARAAQARPITREPARSPTPVRAPTSMAAGERRPCSAATTGRRPRASPTTEPGRQRARRALTTAARSRETDQEQATTVSSPATATTCTPATTGTSTRRTTAAAGRSTTTATGTTSTGRIRTSIATAPRARKARRAHATPARISAAAAAALEATAAVAVPAAAAAVPGAAEEDGGRSA